MEHLDNPILNSAWRDTGPVLPSPSSPAPTKMSEPRVSAETKRIIGELALKFPASAALSPTEHAAQLALLCRDLIDVEPRFLRHAAEQWSRENKWMPRASELRDLARSLAIPKSSNGGETEAERWKRRVDEGNRMLIEDGMAGRAHWEVGSSGIGCALREGPMTSEQHADAMKIDPAVYRHLRERRVTH
jgi:hypothetical protein